MTELGPMEIGLIALFIAVEFAAVKLTKVFAGMGRLAQRLIPIDPDEER